MKTEKESGQYDDARDKMANHIAGHIISKQLWLARQMNSWFQELTPRGRNGVVTGFLIALCFLGYLLLTCQWNHFRYDKKQNILTSHPGPPPRTTPPEKIVKSTDSITIKH